MRQKSSFRHNAAPPRATFLGVPMWWRQSSAYGYAQAKDSTWEWYQQKTGNWGADRDNYADAVDCMIDNKFRIFLRVTAVVLVFYP